MREFLEVGAAAECAVARASDHHDGYTAFKPFKPSRKCVEVLVVIGVRALGSVERQHTDSRLDVPMNGLERPPWIRSILRA